MKRAPTLLLLMIGLLPEGAARADVPAVDLSARRAADDRVRIDLSLGYHRDNVWGLSCDRTVGRVRADAPEGSEPEALLTFSGRSGADCSCWLDWMAPEGPVPDATGMACSWVDAPCPEPFACACSFACEPVFDTPCNGAYRYELHTVFDREWTYTSHIAVDWREACPPSGGGGDGGVGCGCGVGPTLPEALVVLIFLGAALLPGAWARWRRGRRPPPAA